MNNRGSSALVGVYTSAQALLGGLKLVDIIRAAEKDRRARWSQRGTLWQQAK